MQCSPNSEIRLIASSAAAHSLGGFELWNQVMSFLQASGDDGLFERMAAAIIRARWNIESRSGSGVNSPGAVAADRHSNGMLLQRTQIHAALASITTEPAPTSSLSTSEIGANDLDSPLSQPPDQRLAHNFPRKRLKLDLFEVGEICGGKERIVLGRGDGVDA